MTALSVIFLYFVHSTHVTILQYTVYKIVLLICLNCGCILIIVIIGVICSIIQVIIGHNAVFSSAIISDANTSYGILSMITEALHWTALLHTRKPWDSERLVGARWMLTLIYVVLRQLAHLTVHHACIAPQERFLARRQLQQGTRVQPSEQHAMESVKESHLDSLWMWGFVHHPKCVYLLTVVMWMSSEFGLVWVHTHVWSHLLQHEEHSHLLLNIHLLRRLARGLLPVHPPWSWSTTEIIIIKNNI